MTMKRLLGLFKRNRNATSKDREANRSRIAPLGVETMESRTLVTGMVALLPVTCQRVIAGTENSDEAWVLLDTKNNNNSADDVIVAHLRTGQDSVDVSLPRASVKSILVALGDGADT